MCYCVDLIAYLDDDKNELPYPCEDCPYYVKKTGVCTLDVEKSLQRAAEKIKATHPIMNNPLTIEQLKLLKKGDWVWIIDKELPINTGYYKIKSINVTHILLQQGLAENLIPYALYGKEWIAYKNKEQAEQK